MIEKSRLSSKDRIITTLNLEKPDRIPTAFHNSAVVAELSGMDYGDFFQNGEAMAASHIKAQERFHYDGIIIDSGTHCSAQTLGCGAGYLDKKYPVTTTPVLDELSDIDNLNLPDPRSTFPASEMISCIRLIREHFNDQIAIIATGDQGPFTLSALLVGMEKWLILVATSEETDQLHKILDFAQRYATEYAVALYEAGAHVVRFGDSLGGTQVVSPETYDEWTLPYEKRLIESLKAYKFPTSIHICGNATSILDGMVSTGANMIEVDELSDFMRTCLACTGRTALLGPVSPSNMVFRDYDFVKEEARIAIDTARRAGTSLILGAGCSMAGDTPIESIDAVVDAASQFGRYP